MERERQEKTPTISEIVSAANVIKHSFMLLFNITASYSHYAKVTILY